MQNEVSAFLFVPQSAAMHTKIYGLTVLERTLHALERGGVEQVFLPENQQGKLPAAVKNSKDWKIDIRFSGGFSAGLWASEGALVLAEPLVIDPKCIQLLLENRQQTSGVLVAKNGGIGWFPAAVLQGLGSTEPGFSSLLEQAKQHEISIETIDFQGLVCIIVHTPDDRKSIEKALIRSLIKPTDGWVSRHLNRPISTSISRVLAHSAITPNQFTIVTGLVGVSTAWFLAAGGYWNYLIGGALFHLTSVLDGVDGELARLKFKSSPFGQWLDTVVDNLSYLAALGGIIAGIYLHGAPDYIMVAGILAVVFALLALGSLYFYLLRFKSGGTLLNVKYSFQDGNSTFDKIFQIAGAFGKRDLFALIFFILGIFGKMQWALIYIAIMAFMVFLFSIQSHIMAAKSKN
ncbi:MAG: CDP-alcohol phosphatidyltransferase family protein [Bacteroidetes bacterium]|nr:CDP-alcohol phosphatidyltransferase family protein [Bacteroidota bacterium]